jgi:hypothetical protein
MATLQEKQRTGILSKLNSSGQSGEKKDLMERVRRTSEQGLGDPERSNIRRKEQDRPTLQRQADLTARTREREYGAKVGTPEFGRALAAEYAEKYDKDKPPGAPKQDFGGPKQIAEIEEGEDLISQMSREDIRKAQKELAEKGARYREALQGRGAPAEAVRTMAEVGEVGDVRDVEDPGFAESYDEAVQFQEEEYGGGSLEREAALSEILGVDRQTRRESPRREDLIEGGRYAFDEFYEEAKAANPEGREEDWQDAAIKAYNRSKAEDAAEFARTFEVEDTAQVSGKMEDYAAKRAAELREERLKREAEAAKKKEDVVSKAVSRVQGKAPAQPVVTPQEAAERITPLLERYKGAAVPFDDFIQQITSVEEEPSIEEPAEPAVKEEAPVAAADSPKEVFDSYSDLQKAAVLRQPGGEGFSEALESLSVGDLGGFNRVTAGQGQFVLGRDPKNPSKIVRQFKPRFSVFLDRIPEDLKTSIVEQLNEKVSEKGPELLQQIKTPIEQTLYAQVSDMKGVPTAEDEAVIKRFTDRFADYYFNAPAASRGAFGKGPQREQLIQDFMEAIGASPTYGQRFRGTFSAPAVGYASDIFANKPALYDDLLNFIQARDTLSNVSDYTESEGSPLESVIASAASE